MKAINCIFRETIKEDKFEMKSHILVFLDNNGTEQSAPFTEVRFDGHFDSYQFEGGRHTTSCNPCWKRYIIKNVNE